MTTPFSIALARGLILSTRYHEARELIDTTIALCNRIGERFAMPELLRMKAKLMHLIDGNVSTTGEGLLNEAMTLAREQGSRGWELRISADLAKLPAKS